MTMADLETQVRYLKGIGEKKALALGKLGVVTVRDLVSFFPRRYEDRSQYKPIALTRDGESVCIYAIVADTPSLSRIRRGLEIVRFRAVDESGQPLPVSYAPALVLTGSHAAKHRRGVKSCFRL